MRANNWVWLAIAMLVLGLTTTNNIYADSTGATSPTDATDTPSSIDDFGDATNDNAFASDNVRVTAELDEDQAYGAFGFDITIPAGSTIDGITVSIEARRDSTFPTCGSIIGSPSFDVRLSDPTLVGAPTGLGSFIGDIKTTGSFGAIDSILSVGGSSDTWSLTHTDSSIDNLWVLLTTNCGTAPLSFMELDHLTVEVEYTLPPEEPEQQGGGQDEFEWMTKPTFGISPTSHQLVIKCGFAMDSKCFDMTDEWHTPFDKIVINTGETHDFELNIQSQMRLKDAGFCLVPQIGSMEGELCLGVSLDGNGGIIGTEINQDEQLVDQSKITFGVGRDGANYKILINNVEFLDQPFYEVIGLYATDYQPRIVNTFLNEGIDVIGESFVEQPIVKIASNEKQRHSYGGDNSGTITLTRIDKFENLWATEDGVRYTFNSFGTPIKVSQDEVQRIRDGAEMTMTRNNSNFQLIKDWAIDQAEQKMREMYPSLFKEQEFSELENIVTHDEPYINHKEILASKLFN